MSTNHRQFDRHLLWIGMLVAVLLLASCGGSDTSTKTGFAPVTVQNCRHTLKFTKVPTRVISTGQTTTDILLKLGLGDRIIGTYYKKIYQPEPQFTAAYAKIHDFGGDMISSVPSKEVVLGARPDFVFSAYPAGDFLPSYGMATEEQFTAQGAPVYGMSGECSDDTTHARLEDFYTDILNIGKIFQHDSEAQHIVSDLKTRIGAVQKRVASLPPVPVVAIPMSNPAASGEVLVIGGGIYTDVLRLAGARNVFGDQTKTYPTIGKEVFATQKPDVYVLIHYAGIDPEKVTSYFYTTFPDLPASKKQQTVVIEANHWNAGIFLADAIEQVAKAIHPDAF